MDAKAGTPNGSRVAVVIEDDADTRRLLELVLVDGGFDVVLAEDAADGIEAVREHDPAVTVLDVNLPGMDGFAAARSIRSFSDTMLVMLSGRTDEIDVIEGLASGADEYLYKPFRPRELRARVDTLLRRPRGRESVAETAVAEEVAATPTWPAPRPLVAADVPASVAPLAPLARTEPTLPATVWPAPVPVPAAETPAPIQRAESRKETLTGLEVDPYRRAAWLDGRPLDLSDGEFRLLVSLLESGHRVRSTTNLVLELRGEGYVTAGPVNDAERRLVTDTMNSLLRKLGDDGPAPRWIEPVHGVGFRLMPTARVA